MDRPKWLRSPSALLSEKKTKSSIRVAVQATNWVKDQLTRNRPYLALFGERCTSANISARTPPPAAKDGYNWATTQPTAAFRPDANSATKPTTAKTTTVTSYTAQRAKANPAPTPSENAPAAKKPLTSWEIGTALIEPEHEAQPLHLRERPPPLGPNKYGDH